MIPTASIIAWRNTNAPWESDAQVEQDLILSRILVDIFSDEYLASNLAFRGGTALQKLFSKHPARYSEDIDLVQINAGPIGRLMTALRRRIDPWLGKPKWKQKEGRVTFYYRCVTEIQPVEEMRIKIEINTREHFTVLGLNKIPFKIENIWFSGRTLITMYLLEELLGTKLRALYQRKKGRDLFDLGYFMETYPNCNWETVVSCFNEYTGKENQKVTRAMFEENFYNKVHQKEFFDDIRPLLAYEYSRQYNPNKVVQEITKNILPHLKGESWKRETN